MSFGAADNPKLAALWVLDRAQAIQLCMRALESSEGNVKEAARLLRCSRTTLHTRINENPILKEHLKEIRKPSLRKSRRTP